MTDAGKEGLWKMTGTSNVVSFFDWANGEHKTSHITLLIKNVLLLIRMQISNGLT
jgi:hypothetical protein